MHLWKQVWLMTTLVLSCCLAGISAWAADIIVDDVTCSLADAITAANTNADAGDCTGSGTYGDDTILLKTNVLLTASLPEITSTITVEGEGHTIDGNNDQNVGSVLRISSTGDLTLNETTITGGNAEGYGGGICTYSGTVTLNNSTVTGNSVSSSSSSASNFIYYSEGGGIYNGYGTVILNNSTVTGNSVSSSSSSSSSFLYYSNGGGIYSGGTVTLNNSTVSGNFLSLSFSSAYSATLSGNGGGIYSGDTAILRSSIVSGNIVIVNGNSSGDEICGAVTADSYNLFGHDGETSRQAFSSDFTPGSSDIMATSDGTAPTALDAILSPLADNGGPTLTHALVEGSPAVDLDRECSTYLTKDQRGEPRPLGGGCDAGSFESVYSMRMKSMPWIYLLLL